MSDPMQTCRECGRRFQIQPLLDLPQPSRCLECLIRLDAAHPVAETNVNAPAMLSCLPRLPVADEGHE
jgi:hypothetical protein